MADQLVLIAQFFRFDGWLINIENSLSVSMALLLALVQPSPCCRVLSLHCVLSLPSACSQAGPVMVAGAPARLQ